MDTRFDTRYWITGQGLATPVEELETDHAMNILRMLVTKPDRTLAMLLNDIEKTPFCMAAWTPDKKATKVQSIHNATSMTAQELRVFALESTLGQALLCELAHRGVNVTNIVSLYEATTQH